MTFLSSRTSLVALTLVACVVCAAIYLAEGHSSGDTPPRATEVARADVDFAYEVRDERQLVGAADNVFVGRVVGKVGATETPILPDDSDAAPGSPRTQFRVQVENNLKGDLDGLVEVSQEGGYVDYVADRGPEKGRRVQALVLYEGNSLLEPGQRYMFVTNRNQQERYNQIGAAGYGNIPVGSGPDEELLAPLVNKFAGAVDEQIDPMLTEVPTREIPPKYIEGEDVPGHAEGAHNGAL